MKETPRHIAVIMDGNGRWAQQRGLPRLMGHREGAKSARDCVEGCIDHRVEFLTLYAFSAENWRRPAEEVGGLMGLLEGFLRERTQEMLEQGVRLHTIGRTAELPANCREMLRYTMEQTAKNSRLHLILALNYSGRNELVDAVKRIAIEVKSGRLDEGAIDEGVIARNLDTREFPDPDLLIRTSGEMRISNFLLWQLSYTEIHMSQKLWPDFRKADLTCAIEDYLGRHRRFGGV